MSLAVGVTQLFIEGYQYHVISGIVEYPGFKFVPCVQVTIANKPDIKLQQCTRRVLIKFSDTNERMWTGYAKLLFPREASISDTTTIAFVIDGTWRFG